LLILFPGVSLREKILEARWVCQIFDGALSFMSKSNPPKTAKNRWAICKRLTDNWL
jgi:hypothetical protein